MYCTGHVIRNKNAGSGWTSIWEGVPLRFIESRPVLCRNLVQTSRVSVDTACLTLKRVRHGLILRIFCTVLPVVLHCSADVLDLLLFYLKQP